MNSPEMPIFESNEDEPTFEYVFYNGTGDSNRKKIGKPILAKSDLEAMQAFSSQNGREYGEESDSFSRITLD